MSFINDAIFDDGLDGVGSVWLDICSSDPGGVYATMVAATLGNEAVVVGAAEDGAVDGRRFVVPAIAAGSVTATGTATHWALNNGTDTVIASGALSSSGAVTSGQSFSLDPVSVTIRDPA